jgi:hypothetical protein
MSATPKIAPSAIPTFVPVFKDDEEAATAAGDVLEVGDADGDNDAVKDADEYNDAVSDADGEDDVALRTPEAVTGENEAPWDGELPQSGPLYSRNCVEYWYCPVTSSISCKPYLESDVASNEADGVQLNEPELAMPVARVESGTALLEGPRRRSKETVLGVVGCHVIVKGLQAGTIYTVSERRIANRVVSTYFVEWSCKGIPGRVSHRRVLRARKADD